jgi:predicted ATP-dependent endonuclease of OLD family
MRIRKVHIKNFRAIDELELDFADLNDKALDLAILAGPNGCGKTSVLEACLLALGEDKLLPRKPPAQDYAIQVVFDLDVQQLTVTRNPKKHEIISQDGTRQTFYPHKYGCRTFFFSSWRAPKLVGGVPLLVGRGKRPSNTTENTLLRLKNRLIAMRSLAGFNKNDVTKIQEADELFAKLGKAWKMFYPEANSHFEADTISKAPVNVGTGKIEFDEEEETRFDVYYKESQESPRISIDDLSSGEIEILSMLGMFVINNIPYNIVLIDEPELHLHPAWHRAILPALQKVSPGTQFICATHSQDILDSVYSFQRFTLLPEDDFRVRMKESQGVVQEGAV